MVFIDLISRALISKEEKERLKKLCSSYMNDPNKLKQTYRTMTMKLQDNPDELNRLNHEYENILNNINDTLVNNFLQPGDNSNIYSNYLLD